ncbi:MAG: HD domain-containing protein [Patescibacteria group bacterium]|jgi:poly(A) polymerase/tRNA nucleotidyltransferase (CCA-adding enzyme)
MKIPKYLEEIINKLEEGGYDAWIVGGCVRDLLLEKEPNDWDITTSATPEEMLKIFPDGHYENDFGTVILPIKNEVGENLDAIEVTTFRSEQGYSDRRRPDEVVFEKDVEADLARRDFTINALAMKKADSKIVVKDDLKEFIIPFQSITLRRSLSKEDSAGVSRQSPLAGDSDKTNVKDDWIILDLFGGVKDLGKKMIRAVGEPMDRFKEDSLRMMRAIRFSAQLNFKIEEKTERAILKMAGALKFIARERIAIELVKILKSDRPYEGIMALHETKLLQYIIADLEQGVGIDQSRHHIYTVFEHDVLALKHCPNKEWQVRFAALIHDIGKPKTKKIINGIATFYNHEYVGAKLADKICRNLKFSADDTFRIANLVRNHMFYYNAGEVTAASVRRLIKKVGRENLKDLIDLRIADRLGSGTPKAEPYKLRHLQYMFERVQNDPVSVKMLKINGTDLMDDLKIPPSPKLGEILDVLLGEVIENPENNEKEFLLSRARELNEMNSAELRARAKDLIEEKREEEDKKMKRGYKV